MPFGIKNNGIHTNIFLHIHTRMSLEGYYVCGYCNYQTKSKEDITKHDKTLSHLGHFKHLYCESCDIQCWTKFKFNEHCDTSKHKKLANISMECETCNYTTSSKQLMDQHMMTQKHKNAVNGVVKELLICEKCDYKTKFKSQFKQHEETEKHQNNIRGIVKLQEHECVGCSYKTPFKSSLDVHKRSKKHIKNMEASQTKL